MTPARLDRDVLAYHRELRRPAPPQVAAAPGWPGLRAVPRSRKASCRCLAIILAVCPVGGASCRWPRSRPATSPAAQQLPAPPLPVVLSPPENFLCPESPTPPRRFNAVLDQLSPATPSSRSVPVVLVPLLHHQIAPTCSRTGPFPFLPSSPLPLSHPLPPHLFQWPARAAKTATIALPSDVE